MERFDAFVIGGGGTGSEVAFRLAQRGNGMRVALAERDRLGGECNHFGCVPTKVMLKSAAIAAQGRDSARFGVRIPGVEVDLRAVQQRARDVAAAQSGGGAEPFERAGIAVFMQRARLVGPSRVELEDGTSVAAEHIVLATGSEASVPGIEGLAGGPFWTNREAIWEPATVPGSLAVLGSGAIGLEFAQCYARFGSRVTVIEAVPMIAPGEEEASARSMHDALADEGIEFLVDTTVTKADHADDTWSLSTGGGRQLRSHRLLVAVGRQVVLDGHDLRAAGVELDDHGAPRLGPTLRTTNDRIWAAGDVTGDLMFTHVGTYEAGIVADDVLGRPRPRDYRVVPRVTYCEPEMANVGVTEAEARSAGRDVRAATVSVDDNERNHIDGRRLGVVKLVAEAGSGRVLGGHIVAADAGAMIHEVVAAMSTRAPARTIGDAIHAYPTLSESVKAAFATLADELD